MALSLLLSIDRLPSSLSCTSLCIRGDFQFASKLLAPLEKDRKAVLKDVTHLATLFPYLSLFSVNFSVFIRRVIFFLADVAAL